jgi:RHS repeat-associated protein
MTLDTEFDPIYGNLISRTSTNLFSTWTENLTYDELDRLKNYKNTAGVQTQTYNDNGTIATNNIGSYAYTISNKPFQVSTVTPLFPSAVYDYYNAREQNITYNVYKSPVTISELTKEKIDFEYNSSNSRTAMYYGDMQALKNNRSFRKYYSADGLMEIKYKLSAPSSIEFVTYIGGDAYTAPLVLKSDGTTQEYLNLHRDYQGTINAITNSLGVVVEKRNFDVWGSLIQYANNSGITTLPSNSTSMLLDRGYTGHEHLLGVGLINMNGRIYDDKLHKFLQPDNNIQDPYNTQNFNRYGYGLNNPTKYTDPSGESWEILGFLFSTYVHGAQATGEANPLKWNVGQVANAVFGAGGIGSIVVSNYTSNKVDTYVQNYGTTQDKASNNKNYSNNSVEDHEYVSTEYNNEDIAWATKATGVLLADDLVSGGALVVDDVLIPVVWGIAGGMWITENWVPIQISAREGINTITELANPNSGAFKYVTYTKTNAEGLVYVGRSSGYGTPEQIVMNRDRMHHMGKSMIGPLNLKDFGTAKLSSWVASTKIEGYSNRSTDPAYWAIRGVEQLQINYHTIQGNSANTRAGIYQFNENIQKYMEWGANLLGF